MFEHGRVLHAWPSYNTSDAHIRVILNTVGTLVAVLSFSPVSFGNNTQTRVIFERKSTVEYLRKMHSVSATYSL